MATPGRWRRRDEASVIDLLSRSQAEAPVIFAIPNSGIAADIRVVSAVSRGAGRP